MKMLVIKEKLLTAVLIAERITGKKETLPVLSCILFKVEKGLLAVPSGVLSQTLRSIGGDKVTLSLGEGNLVIESRGTRTLIKSVSHEEFPTLPGDKKKNHSWRRASI